MWCEHLERHEDSLNDFVRKQMSHVINVHHIWISRLDGQPVESGSWDLLPVSYWQKLSRENYQRTTDYLDHLDLEEKIRYHSEEGVPLEKSAVDILYHILQHSQYHRAQIARELRLLELPVPSFNFITYR